MNYWGNAVQLPEPVYVQDLFQPDRDALIALLDSLTAEEWERPTACEGWSVKDVALHILGGDLGNLSRRRDGATGVLFAPDEDLVSAINRANEEWVQVTRRLSTRVLRDLLEMVGPPLFDYFASLDLDAIGESVSWAGPQPAPVWLDVAREYTERWHHQQHIRDAVCIPGQRGRRFLHPVLATFVHALPVALGDVDAPRGSIVHFRVEGEAGGDWSVRREDGGWRLYTGTPESVTASVTMAQETAWKLLTRGLDAGAARAQATLQGDETLAGALLRAVAIIA